MIKIKKPKVLVTGGTGFIGSHLVERLVKEGYKVRVLVKEKNPQEIPSDKRDSWNLLTRLGVEISFGDLLDKNSLKKAIKDIGLVFHLAAIARPMAIPRELYFKVNEEGTKNLLDACLTNKKLEKFILMSSVSAVGQSRDGNPVNEKTKCLPVDTYGWSKLAQEKIALEYSKNNKIPLVILRPPMVFGPRDFEMLKLFKAVDIGFFPIKCDVKCLEFLYVENLVEACILAYKRGKKGEIYHITNGEHYSLNDVIKSIEKNQKKTILPIKIPYKTFMLVGGIMEFLGKTLGFHPPFKHDTIDWMTKKLWYSNPEKAKNQLGYQPPFSLDEGVKRATKYYKESSLID